MKQDDFNKLSRDEYEQLCRLAIEPYISEQATTCSYCDRIEPLILSEGNRTYITLALGQIIPGYVQITPIEHRTSVAGLSDDEIKEFEIMKDIVRQVYKEVYGTPGVAFEHGKVGACMTRQRAEYSRQKTSLCHHTHVHFAPASIDISARIEQIIPDPILVRSATEIKELRQGIHLGDPYLYFERENGEGLFFPVEDTTAIPRQFLRTSVAEALDRPERADWFAHPGIEYFYESRKKLAPRLHELVNQRIKHG